MQYQHECVRREKMLDFQVSECQMKFCYECVEWFLFQQCDVIRHRHTRHAPCLLPCLWDPDLPAEERLQYWLRSGNLREHMHIESMDMLGIRWPMRDPVCGCALTFELRHHLHDVHGLKETVWLNTRPPRERKCHCEAEGRGSSKQAEEDRPKKIRFYHFPPLHPSAPSVSTFSMRICHMPASLPFEGEHPERCYCPSVSDMTNTGVAATLVQSAFPG